MAAAEGVEPSLSHSECDMLPGYITPQKKFQGWDLNPRFSVYEADDLTTCLPWCIPQNLLNNEVLKNKCRALPAVVHLLSNIFTQLANNLLILLHSLLEFQY